jgi:hypothetical protein
MISRSVLQMPARRTRTSASPAAGTGTGTVCSSPTESPAVRTRNASMLAGTAGLRFESHTSTAPPPAIKAAVPTPNSLREPRSICGERAASTWRSAHHHHHEAKKKHAEVASTAGAPSLLPQVLRASHARARYTPRRNICGSSVFHIRATRQRGPAIVPACCLVLLATRH